MALYALIDGGLIHNAAGNPGVLVFGPLTESRTFRRRKRDSGHLFNDESGGAFEGRAAAQTRPGWQIGFKSDLDAADREAFPSVARQDTKSVVCPVVGAGERRLAG